MCVKHIKAFKGAIMWQIKRASAKGSAFTWTSGERALEACRSSQWGRFDGTYIQMIGVKLQSAGRRRVQGQMRVQASTLLLHHAIESLMVVCFCLMLLKPRLLLKPKLLLTLLRRPSSSRLYNYWSGWACNRTSPLSCRLLGSSACI